MKTVTVSAPGKLHLSGEHAVVYGKPAIIVSTSLRLFVTLTQGAAGELSAHRERDKYVDAICGVFEKKHGVTVPDNLSVKISSSIPVGAGMGSSAALAVAFAGALTVWSGFPWNAQTINDMAYQAEKTKHGNSSGSDPAVATHGGLLWYRKELEFLKTLWLLPLKVPKTFTPFIIVNTGRAESTGDLVGRVAADRVRRPARVERICSGIEATTRRMAQALHDEDETVFCKTISENERLLEQLGIVSKGTAAFIREIEALGGVAKISGAGGRKTGSGVVLVVCRHKDAVENLVKRYRYDAFPALLGGEGVKMEQVLA